MSDQARDASEGPAARVGWFRRWGTPALILTYDTVAGTLAMFASLMIRYLYTPFGAPPGPVEFVAAGLFAPVCLGVFLAMGVHRGLWRHTAVNDVARVLQAILLAHLIFLPILFTLTRLEDFPRSTFALSAPLMAFLILAPRLAASAWRSGDLRAMFTRENASAPIAVLVGPRARMAEVMRSQMRRSGGPVFRFRALVETDGRMYGRALYGVPLDAGLERLETAVDRVRGMAGSEPVRIVLADENPEPSLVNAAARVAGRTGAKLTRARGDNGARAFTSIEASDLLARTPRALSRAGARRLITGRRVLVTGAGGTIGAELVRQAATLEPEKLILLDAAESHLYEIDLEIANLADAPPWRAVLGDIRDRNGLRALMDSERPDVVLHAAALKHVPLMEANAPETVLTNVLGTQNVVDLSAEFGVDSVVLISTDKAVDPSSVMGASKRAAELLLAKAAERHPGLNLASVRFGNVLASVGSVVPLFERQIAAGGPVTVTHPETTRYFMTVEEAAGLVLEAGAQAGVRNAAGGLFLLDMGEPVLIARLARQLIRLRGFEPGRDIEIEYTGLRPGEKLHEALIHAFEYTEPAGPAGVLRVCAPELDLSDLEPELQALYVAADARDEAAVLDQLRVIVGHGWPAGVATLSAPLSASS